MPQLYVDVSCPFSLLAARRARAALGELLPARELRLRACPLWAEGRPKAGAGEKARRALLRRLEVAAQLEGGENFETGLEALRSGALKMPSSLQPLAALKWVESVGGERAAFRFFVEVTSRCLEHGEGIDRPAALAEVAKEQGLPHERLLRVLESELHLASVERDRRSAKELGLGLVPVLLLDDGELVEGLVARDEYRERIALALRRQRKARLPQ